MKITDTIFARSEADAERQLEKLYPDLESFTLTERRNSLGEESSSGHYFTFSIDHPEPEKLFDKGEYLDGDWFELEEDEY